MAKLISLIAVFIIGSGILIWQYLAEPTEEANIEEEIKIIEKEKTELFSKTNWQWLAGQKKLYQLNQAEINLVLEQLWERFPIVAERLKALSILGLGAPYQLGPLGEEIGRDKDPVFRIDKFDCTTFVLTKTALLYSQNLKQAREMMKFLNYGLEENLLTREKEPKITFENRLHFTSFRNKVSPYFRDITEQIAGPERIREKKIILNKIKPDGQRLIDIDWEKEIILKYIPSEHINKKLLGELPKAVGIAFIRAGDEKIGLDVRHEGFLFDSELFFHASSKRGQVVVDNFLEWYFSQDNIPKFQGVIFFDLAIDRAQI